MDHQPHLPHNTSPQHIRIRPPERQLQFSMQSMPHELSGSEQSQRNIHSKHLHSQIDKIKERQSYAKTSSFSLALHSLQDFIMLVILLELHKTSLKLTGMIKQQFETRVRIELKLDNPNVLDINQNINKQQQLENTIRQYFFLSPMLPTHSDQQHKDLQTNLIAHLLLLLFESTAMVLFDLTQLDAWISHNINTFLSLLRSNCVTIGYISNNILFLQQKEEKYKEMQERRYHSGIDDPNKEVYHSPCLIRASKIIYLHFDKICAYLTKQFPLDASRLILQNKETLHNNLDERLCKVKIFMNVGDAINLKYLIEFNSTQSLRCFLSKAYQLHLWAGIQYLHSEQLPAESISLQEVEKFTNRMEHYRSTSESKVQDGNYCQSYQHQIQDPFSFDRINEILKKQDILGLKEIWDCALKERMEEICANWEVYGRIYRKQLQIFTVAHLYKMKKMELALKNQHNSNHFSLYENIYPRITYFVQVLSKKLGIDNNFLKNGLMKSKQRNECELHVQNIKDEFQLQQNITDKILYYFIKEQQDRSLNLNIIPQQSMPMSEYISSCNNFYLRAQHWNHIFTTLLHLIRPHNSKHNQQFKTVEQQRLVEHRCLACSTFFIQSQNIYDELVNACPVRVLGSVERLRESQPMLKDEICGLLNSGGGVILFDCMKVYRQIRPVGFLLNQRDKQQCQQRIYSYMYQFHPKLQVKSHILVNFVPIVNPNSNSEVGLSKYSGTEGILKDNYEYIKKNMYQARFVTRIRVVPADPSLLYFWFVPPKPQDQEMKKYCLTLQNKSTLSKLSTRGMSKLLKTKMNQFYSQRQGNILCLPSLLITHNCVEPYQGISMYNNIYSTLKNQSKRNKQLNIEFRYKNLSLLMTNHANHKAIRQNFKKANLNFHLDVLFADQGFKDVKNTAALYHNNKFQEIYWEISHGKYDSQVIVINVTSYLKLEARNQRNHYPKELFSQLYEAFSKAYSEESLKLYRYRLSPIKHQYYLLTQTKTSNLFLFYLLNQKQEKAVFKNPYLLDKLNPTEREQRMILEYQKTGRNDILYQQKSNPQSLIKNSQSLMVDVDGGAKEQNNRTMHEAEGVEQEDESWYAKWQQMYSQYDYSGSSQEINLLK